MTTITLEIPETEKSVIEHASSLSNMNIDEFIRQQAYQQAVTVIKLEAATSKAPNNALGLWADADNIVDGLAYQEKLREAW